MLEKHIFVPACDLPGPLAYPDLDPSHPVQEGWGAILGEGVWALSHCGCKHTQLRYGAMIRAAV